MKGFIAQLLIVASVCLPTHAIAKSYLGNNSPERNSESPMSKDRASPSSIVIQSTFNTPVTPLQLDFRPHVKTISNNGHTLQLNIDDADDIAVEGSHFKLKQFHFHIPSDSRNGEISYPLAANFMYSDAYGNLAILAVMFTIGAKNQALQPIIDQAPSLKNETVELNKTLDITSLFPKSTDYYRFSSSLTTPPRTKGARRLVMKESISLSARQLAAVKSKLDIAHHRSHLPLHGRVLMDDAIKLECDRNFFTSIITT